MPHDALVHLNRLCIHNFRNLEATELQPGPGLVLVTGPNGSGKTSLIEVVWMLGTSRSFRSSRAGPVIRHGASSLTVFGELGIVGGGCVALGVTRTRSGGVDIKVAGEPVRSASKLASRMPVQLIDPGAVELVTGGPERRRRFLDWGAFHMEPSFWETWRTFRRALEQRNALLRSDGSASELDLWERQLAKAAVLMDSARAAYVKALQPLICEVLRELGEPPDIQLSYVRGWDSSRDYTALLLANREADRKLGYTQAGPQRADLKLVASGRRAADVLSRGQQKILACSLLIAQTRQLETVTDKAGICLVDDLPAELDADHRRCLWEVLISMRGQVWVTAVEPELVLDGSGTAGGLTRFHMEQGRIVQG